MIRQADLAFAAIEQEVLSAGEDEREAIKYDLDLLVGEIDNFEKLLAGTFPDIRLPLHDVLKKIPLIEPVRPEVVTEPLDQALRFLNDVGTVRKDIDAAEAAVRRNIAAARKGIAAARNALSKLSQSAQLKPITGKNGILQNMQLFAAGVDRALQRAERSAKTAFATARREFVLNPKNEEKRRQAYKGALEQSVAAVQMARADALAILTKLNGTPDEKFSGEIKKLNYILRKIKKPEEITNVPFQGYDQVTADANRIISVLKTQTDRIAATRNGAIAKVSQFKARVGDFKAQLDADFNAAKQSLLSALADIRTVAFKKDSEQRYALSGEIVKKLSMTIADIGKPDQIERFCNEAIGNAFADVNKALKPIIDSVLGEFKNKEQMFAKLKGELENNINDIVGDVGDDLNRLKDRLGGAFEELRSQADAMVARGVDDLRRIILDKIDPDFARGLDDVAIRLYRAFGDPPKVPSLGFNRETLAYFFDEDALKIDTTPVAALFDRVGEDLKGLGMRVPMTGLTERLLPQLDDFKIGDLFPDIGGIKLDRLLEKALVPDGAEEYVNITHGIDKEAQIGWINAEVIPITVQGSEPLFEFIGLSVALQDGAFSGSARQQISLSGEQVSSGQGEMKGDWQLSFGGKDLVTFVDTPLTFDQTGRFDFGVSPENVRLAPELSFIDKFLNSNPLIGGQGEGFTVGILQDGLVPVGVECLLDLPIPPMIYGTTGVTGLRLIAGMQVRAIPEFSITIHAAIGSIETPFTITIFILGGTGWIQTYGHYVPRTGELSVSVSLAIGASAMLGFSFGPINGTVQIVVAIKAQLISSNKSKDSLSISLMIICSGQVDVAGLITASLLLVMELRFEDQGRTIYGIGTVSFRIRVCRFFTYRISQSVTYRFKGSGGSKAPPPRRHVNAVA